MVTMRTLLIAMTITALISTGGGALAAWAITNAALTQTEAVAGSDGADGVNGADGVDGADGADGDDGSNGANGAAGPTGQAGRDGAQGLLGVQGLTGLQGLQGVQGEAGAPGPQGEVGPKGEDGLIGPMGLQGLAALSEFAFFTFPEPRSVSAGSGLSLPLAFGSGDLSHILTTDGQGGGTVELGPGVYRLSAGLVCLTGVSLSAGNFRIDTRADSPVFPGIVNTSLVSLTPAITGSGFDVSTSTTVNLAQTTNVGVILGVDDGAGSGLRAQQGWLLIERLG